MKVKAIKVKSFFSVLLLSLLFSTSNFAQEEAWKKEISKDGSIEVDYRIFKALDEKGESIQIVEYNVSTIQALDFNKCIVMMNNISNHKYFSEETEESYKLKDLSENKSLIYYYIDSPWPLPNSDCVSILTIIKKEKSVIYELHSSPNSYEMKDVKRMILSDAIYTFEKRDDNKVKITNYTKFSPTTTVPQWLVNTWFPNGPIEIMKNIIATVQR